MAAKRDSENLADILSCQVCFEEFEETGSRTPRIFPCIHTVCESCIKELIRKDNTIVCPECRKKHEAQNKEKSFPQNKYLLAQIMGNNNTTKEQCNDDSCEKHGDLLILYCLEDTCQKSICVSCLMDHNKHDVVGVKDKEREVLGRKVTKIMKNMEAKVEMISKAGKDICDKTDLCVKEVEKTKRKVNQYLDNIIEEAENQKKETNKHVREDVSAMREEIKRLGQIQQDLGPENKNSPEVIKKMQETVGGIIENEKNTPGTRYYMYPVFNMDPPPEEKLGRVTKTVVTVVLPECEVAKAKETKNLLPRRVTDASQLKWTGTSVTFVCCHEVNKVLWDTSSIQVWPL